ncbi:MAG: hypothetical protein R3A78_07715 [Polyangiales bacterium]
MALVQRPTEGISARLVGFGAAAMGPFAFYVATSSAFAYWLDGGEFVAASTDSASPTHPGIRSLRSLARSSRPFPSDPSRLSRRRGVRQHSRSRVQRALRHGNHRASHGRRIVARRVPLAVGGAWVTAASGFGFRAVPSEVYALEAALLFCARTHRRAGGGMADGEHQAALRGRIHHGPRPAANHHFLTFLLLPAVAPTSPACTAAPRSAAARASFGRTRAHCRASSTYAYLPLRAAAG